MKPIYRLTPDARAFHAIAFVGKDVELVTNRSREKGSASEPIACRVLSVSVLMTGTYGYAVTVQRGDRIPDTYPLAIVESIEEVSS